MSQEVGAFSDHLHSALPQAEEYLSRLSRYPRNSRGTLYVVSPEDAIEFPYLGDLIAAKHPAPIPAAINFYEVIGTPMDDSERTGGVQNWLWLQDKARGTTQSMTRLLTQIGDEYTVVDVYSAVVGMGQTYSLGIRDFIPLTEVSRTQNLLTYLSQTGAHIVGWLPVLDTHQSVPEAS